MATLLPQLPILGHSVSYLARFDVDTDQRCPDGRCPYPMIGLAWPPVGTWSALCRSPPFTRTLAC